MTKRPTSTLVQPLSCDFDFHKAYQYTGILSAQERMLRATPPGLCH
jgi:hypothetical protein